MGELRFSVDTFEHVLGHVSKAAGKLHGLVGDMDHIREIRGSDCARGVAFGVAERDGKPAAVYIADLIICARELAATCPSGPIDIEKAVADRMEEKKNYLKQYGSPSRPKDTRLHIGDVVVFKATGMVTKVDRFAHDGTTDFWADNGTGPYKQADVRRQIDE